MANFMIAYDLKTSGQNCTCITDKLEAMDAFRSQGSVWLYKADTTSGEIRDHLKSCLNDADELMIVQIAAWASYQMWSDAKFLNG